MTRLARVRNTDACHGEEVYVRYASPLFLLSSLPVGHQTVATGCDLNATAYHPSSFVGEASSITAIANRKHHTMRWKRLPVHTPAATPIIPISRNSRFDFPDAPAPNNIRTTSRLFFGTKMRLVPTRAIPARCVRRSESHSYGPTGTPPPERGQPGMTSGLSACVQFLSSSFYLFLNVLRKLCHKAMHI